jgi:hypothetical protein
MRPLRALVCLSSVVLGACLADKGTPLSIEPEEPTELPDPNDCSKIDPGRVTIHRLNRAEYNNTVRDLIEDDTRPADDFPADDHGFGFDNIADVLAMSPLLFEKYQIASENLVLETLKRPFAGPERRRLEAEVIGSDAGAMYHDWGWNLYVVGEVASSIQVAVEGEYELSARAFGQQAGGEPAKMELTVDGRTIRTFDVTAVEATPEVYRARTRLARGAHQVGFAFTNDFYRPENPEGDRDRNLIIDWVEYVGPLDVDAEDPARRARVMICDPEASSNEACARQIFAAFGRRAWRRPLTGEELDRLVALAGVAWAEQDPFDVGIAIGLEAMLLSPHFVFRVELDPNPASIAPHPLTDHELASRLSYFFWSSMPDDALLDLADRGELSDPEVLAREVRRMVGDEKAKALVDNFGGQWLWTRALDDVNPDYAFFPSWDHDLGAAMRAETDSVLHTFLTEPLSALDLIDAPFTFLNDRLASHYGLPLPGSERPVRVPIQSAQRGGLLTHGSVLTVTSHPRRTSPVRRGKWVLEQLLCTSPPPPPPGVEGLPEQVNPSASLRERFEQHRSQEVCKNCHKLMDPIGFSLEHFDAIGAWRDTDSGYAIDASGVLPGDKRFDGHAELARILKEDPALPSCIVQKVFTYALGRGPTDRDRCSLDEIGGSFQSGGYTFESLFQSLASSAPFTQRRGELENGGAR